MTLYKWSQTAASNGTADPSCPFPEGMAPSAVNDSTRGAMAAVAKHRDDIAGAIVTGGTSTAYTVASFQVFDSLAHLNGQMVAFFMHATNAGACTLNVDGLGAKPLRSASGVELSAGTLIQNTPYTAVYNNTSGEFFLHGFFGNPYNIPLAGGMDFWGTTVPNSAFAFPIGQAISRTTYAALFAIMGTTYGVGDGSTTFNLPDKTGRVSAMKEATGTRLTTAIGGVDGGTMGSAAGGQSQTLSLAQLPTGITSANASQAISVTSASGQIWQGVNGNLNAGGGPNGVATIAGLTSTGNNSISVTSNNTSGAAHPIVQPTIICNYIIRII